MLGLRRKSTGSYSGLVHVNLMIDINIFKVTRCVHGLLIIESVLWWYFLGKFSLFGFSCQILFIWNILEIWKILERFSNWRLRHSNALLSRVVDHVFLLLRMKVYLRRIDILLYMLHVTCLSKKFWFRLKLNFLCLV